MEMPKLKECRRDPGYPPLYEWEQQKIGVNSPFLCFVFSKKAPGALGLFLQSADFRTLKTFFVAWFEQFKQSNELLNRAAELQKMYDVKNIFSRLTRPERDFFNFWNSDRKHYSRLSIRPVPNENEKGLFNYHSDLYMQLQSPGRERVFFPAGSEIPSIMAAIPELPGEVSDMDYPAAACICYGIAALYHNEIREPETLPSKKQWDPWANLKRLEDPNFWKCLDQLPDYLNRR